MYGGLKKELNTKVHIAVYARGLPLKILVSDGNVHDSQKAEKLIQDFKAKYLIADKGYDSKTIVVLQKGGIKIVIPLLSNFQNSQIYDKELYKRMHLVENFFLKVKNFRSISSFMAYLAIASIMTYCKLL